MRTIFITGIGTDIGKTVVSAILTEGLKADYWKPVQAGSLENTDSDFVRRMISNDQSIIHPEAFRLKQAMSPHIAAAMEGIEINLKDIRAPGTKQTLIIEGAGGLMVPLNEKLLVIDLIKKLKAKVIIVSRHYLGSINHTLLTVEALKKRKLKICGIIFNGDENKATEEIVSKISGAKCLGRIPEALHIDKEFIRQQAALFTSF
jgi:dethiobiotin synthetase